MNRKIIVIDAGHGGRDSGAIGVDGRKEKVDNLKFSIALAKFLKQFNVDVIETRRTDVFVSLSERTNTANNAKANLFISTHRNAFTNPNSNGYETIFHTNPSSAENQLALDFDNNITNKIPWTLRRRFQQNFQVLRNTNMTAVLLELGFITNANDNRIFDENFNLLIRICASTILRHLGISETKEETANPVFEEPEKPNETKRTKPNLKRILRKIINAKRNTR